MWLNLKFPDSVLENQFLESKRRFHARSFFFIQAFLFLQIGELFYSVLVNAEPSQIIHALPLIITMPVILGLLLLGSWKFPQTASKAISITFLFVAISSAEFLSQFSFENKCAYRMFLLFGMNIEVLGILLVVTKISWIQSMIIFFISNIYCWLRVGSDIIAKVELLFLFSQIIFIASFAYFIEKEDRKIFSGVGNASSQLKTYEEIMNNAIQCSLILMKKDHAIFHNSFAQNCLEIHDQSKFIELLQKIKIIKRGGINQYLNVLGKKQKCLSSNHSFTLYELYKDCETYSFNEHKCFSPGFNSVVGEMKSLCQEKTKMFLIQLGPAVWNGQEGVLLILNDITHIKTYYDTVDSQKDNLLATVSHDLRAPLSGIVGMLNLLLEEIEDKASREKVNISLSSAKLMMHMINDILDFSLISKGKLRLKFGSTNVTSLVEETVKILKLQAEMKGLCLDFEHCFCARENHIVDENRLRQVLFNLIGNAIKYTKEGKIVVRLREELDEVSTNSKEELAQKLEKNFSFDLNDDDEEFESSSPSKKLRKKLIFEVEDTGVGMRREDIGKLFKLFSRVTAGHDENMSGIGLGLAISQSLVMIMNDNLDGAIIKAESTFGKGSIFSFPIYPQKEPDEFFKEVLDEKYRLPIFSTKSLDLRNRVNTKFHTINIPREVDSLILEKENTKIHLLVVDDDQLSLLVASNYLKPSEKSFSFQFATNGEEAIRIVDKHSQEGSFFDVILMDCQMPFMNGFEASKKLKSMMNDRKIRWAPIIAVTGNSSEDDLNKYIDAGMDFTLRKPYTKAELMMKIDDAIKKKQILEY